MWTGAVPAVAQQSEFVPGLYAISHMHRHASSSALRRIVTNQAMRLGNSSFLEDRLRSYPEAVIADDMASKRISGGVHKYQKIFDSLKEEIITGRYEPGKTLPSEAALVHRSGASRITVGRALRELQNLGLVERIAGSGTYVRDLRREQRAHLFGLLIPDLGETEIFEPICQGIANAPEASEHALLWGHTDKQAAKTEQAWQLCQQYISKNVSGVFFAPLEFEAEAEKTNRRISSALKHAGIAVVLLDRRSMKDPERNRHEME